VETRNILLNTSSVDAFIAKQEGTLTVLNTDINKKLIPSRRVPCNLLLGKEEEEEEEQGGEEETRRSIRCCSCCHLVVAVVAKK
jgi:hypothetical protein